MVINPSRPLRAMLGLLISISIAVSPLVPLHTAAPVSAATISVDGSSCTLSDAIQSVLNGSDTGGCSASGSYGTGDTLDLTSSSYTVSSSLPTFDSGNLTVIGNGATITWSGSGRLWIIEDTGTTVRITDLIIRGTGSLSSGLLVRNDASLQLDNLTMESLAGTSGAALAVVSGASAQIQDSSFASNRARFYGGALLASDDGTSVALDDVVIDNNRAGAGGGIAAINGAAVQVSGSQITDNTAVAGGGVFAAIGATVTMTDSTIAENDARLYGGGVFAASAASVSIENSAIENNRADGNGGGIASGTGDGPGAGADVTVRDSTIRGNTAASYGGGLFAIDDSRIAVEGSTIEQNRAGLRGGGLAVTVLASASIADTTIRDNEADFDGGGLEVQRATLELQRVTVSGNQAGRNGGGLNVTDNATVNAVNSTLSANQASQGSAANVESGSTLTLSFVTVADHQGSPAFAVDDTSTLRVKHTILADPAVDECALASGATLQVRGTVLADDASCADPGITVDPTLRSTLGPLQNNGGLTETHALLPGSPALDAVTDCTDWDGNPVGGDQRGVGRPQNGRCDVGAYEYRATTGGGGGSGGGSSSDGGTSDGGNGGTPGQGGAPTLPSVPTTPITESPPAAPFPAGEATAEATRPPISQETAERGEESPLPQLLPRTGAEPAARMTSQSGSVLLALTGLGLLTIGGALLLSCRPREWSPWRSGARSMGQ